MEKPQDPNQQPPNYATPQPYPQQEFGAPSPQQGVPLTQEQQQWQQQQQQWQQQQQQHQQQQNPQAGFAPGGPQVAPTQNLVYVRNLTERPGDVQCPFCQKVVTTKLRWESGTFTHMVAVIAGCCLCLCCVPYFIRRCKDVVHSCPQCSKDLATYDRSSHVTHSHDPRDTQHQR